jgi:hypothetical protein
MRLLSIYRELLAINCRIFIPPENCLSWRQREREREKRLHWIEDPGTMRFNANILLTRQSLAAS